MGSPARQKRLGLSFFAPESLTHLSGYVGLYELSFLTKYVFKWVCPPFGAFFCQNWVVSFDKFVIFETVVTTDFSLEPQRKVYSLVNLSLFYI